MAAAKTEVLLSQLADQLGTRFQRQNLCFRGFPIQWNQMQDCTGSGKFNMAAAQTEKRKYFRFGDPAMLDFPLPVWF
jgi:hypothetical protein